MANQTPFMAKLLQFLGIRQHRMWLRYRDDLSTRTIPKPNMPPGVNHRLANNYYCSRDGRRDMAPPLVIRGAAQKHIESGEQVDGAGEKKTVADFPTPGFGPPP